MSRNEHKSAFDEHPACKRARAAIAARQDELEAWLVALADLNSGSGNRDGLERLARSLGAHVATSAAGAPQFIRHPETQELLALRWKQERPQLPRVLLNGHLDTVYGPESPFQTCAYSPDRRTINGPGVTDMKGGLVILFAALEAFLDSELSERLSWEVLLTCDEETGSFKSRELLEAGARSNDLGIVFESSLPDGSLIRNRMGTGLVVAESKGQAAHSGRDFAEGRNAILALSRFLTAAHQLNDSIPGAIVNVAQVNGGGPANVVPDRARAEINVRAVNADAEGRVMDGLRQAATAASADTRCQISITGGFTRPPKTADAKTEALIRAWQRTASAMGQRLTWKDTGGASDGNILQAAGLPNIDNLGARGNFIHSDKEYIERESLVSRAQLVASFLINLADGRLSLTEEADPA